MRDGEDFAREGTFKVEPGIAMEFLVPKCIGPQSKSEKEGFNEAVLIFGRNRTDTLPWYGISGFVASKKSFHNFQILATEFNTGEAVVAKKNYCSTDQRGYNVRILNENDEEISGLNELNRPVLGLTPEDYARGDGRMFMYEDGTAGLMMERTGHFYILEEVTDGSTFEYDDSCPCKSIRQKGKEKNIFNYLIEFLKMFAF